MKYRDVGRSWRTIAKHALMDGLVGEEAGVGGNMSAVRRHVWIDLTAGDAAEPDGAVWSHGTSPGILARHGVNAAKPVLINLYEIQAATYDRLLGNLDRHLPSFGYLRCDETVWICHEKRAAIQAFNISGHAAAIDQIRTGDAVLTLNDPNAITEWAMRSSFAKEIGERTWLHRSLSTMGCNAAGIKRLPLQQRQDWFHLITSQEAVLPAHRDLLLAAIEKDSAQWAYLIGTSDKWREKTGRLVSKAFAEADRTVAMCWMGIDRGAFNAAKDELFLTQAERLAEIPPAQMELPVEWFA